ncbi:MAG TPA: VacJ family lipoprotein [Rhizomicrobium sp.]|jgi:phospholipid-binding lipoprotein MlaA
MDAKSLLLIFLLGAGVSGCASDDNLAAQEANDPLEPMNRFFFDFNQRLDRHAALPAATFYASAVPRGIRGSVHNVLTNLGGPVDVANNLLQAEFEFAGIAGARFLVNTTLGVAGIFDVATDWGMPERSRDFGETMGVYGVGQGPYLVLPFRGPTSVRDFAGGYVDGYFSPLRLLHYSGSNYVGLVKSSLGSVDNRSANLVTYRDIERASVDYYATMRAYYRQRRERQVEDRAVQTAELPDF